MEIFIIPTVAFLTALLTFFSGFGLGTLLTPVFVFFFPVELAIALTGVVHLSNNLFKISLVGKYTDKQVLLRFGIAAIASSFAGAWLLLRITELPTLFEYRLGSNVYAVTPVKLVIALLLMFFSLLELIPAAQKIQFGRDRLVIGGVLSGFFGGLTGIQGALRSAFLLRSGLSKEAYIATGVVIACLVDFTRLSVYASRYVSGNLSENLVLVTAAVLAAIAGSFAGRRLLNKVTLRFVHNLVAVMLILISVALGAGLI